MVLAYIRYSDLKQGDKNSVEIQMSSINKMAESHNKSIPHENIFIERGKSAYKNKAEDREILMKLKKKIESNPDEPAYVYFYDISRIDRTAFSFVQNFLIPLRDVNPNVVFYEASKARVFDPDDITIKFELALAYNESNKKSMSITDSQDALLKRKERPGGKTPFGYSLENKKLVPNEKDSYIVFFIFYLASWGYSDKEIAKILNTEELHGSQGKEWSNSSITKILNNEAYIGNLKWQFKERRATKFSFSDVHEPLITTFLYNLVMEIKQKKDFLVRLDTPFSLYKLLFCKTCNEMLVGENWTTKKNGTSYTSMVYKCKNCQINIDINLVHQEVIKETGKFINSTFRNEITESAIEINNHITELENELLVQQSFLDKVNVNRNYIKDIKIMSIRNAYFNTKKRLETKIDSIESEITKLRKYIDSEELEFFFDRFNKNMFETLTRTELRFTFAMLIEKVTLSSNGEIYPYFNHNPFKTLIKKNLLSE
ncbi:MAG: hypothetical protein K0S34_36 [Bacillales bacterium]|jgi:hypothetical protein|nr:hypothetical protein [Bacillales bacterium]